MVFQLTQKLVFPDPHYGEPDGLLAVGGDLSVDRLLLAYSNGIFPWYAFREKQIQWWCPLKRFVIFLTRFKHFSLHAYFYEQRTIWSQF